MSGGGGSSNTTQTSVAIPQFEQDASLHNQSLAQSIGAQPFPQYDAPLVAGLTPLQTQGQQMAQNAAGSYAPELAQAQTTAANAVNPSQVNGLLTGGSNALGAAQNPALLNAAANASGGSFGLAQNLTNPNAVSSYMSPYIQASLQPQMEALNLQLANQQQGINSQATQAGAYGDARQGAASSLNNFYGDMAMNQLQGTAYQNAFTAANQALGQAQNTNIAAGQGYNQLGQLGISEQNTMGNIGQQYGSLANTGVNEQQLQLAGAQQMGGLAGLNQSLGLTGAGATYTAGQQQQALQQQELTNAYQQYLNQVNWPVQMLNIQESALSNSPYNINTATTLPNGNSAAQTVGAAAGLAGLLGNAGPNVMGGTR